MNEKVNPLDSIFLDPTRSERNGFTEAIFCQHKNLEQITAIIRKILQNRQNVFGTRLDPSFAPSLTEQFPKLNHDPLSRTFHIVQKPPKPLSGQLAILAGGTSDAPVAEEAYQTARFYGLEAKRFYDVGVAGLQRLLAKLPEIQNCDVAIVIAGMEGALPSVLGGLVSLPIIACPTSVGYGAHCFGWTPLAAMLSSCAEGITVVNIDNGFGAACAALRIFRNNLSKLQEKV